MPNSFKIVLFAPEIPGNTGSIGRKERLIFFENYGQKVHYEAPYARDCYLIFGGETKGFPYEFETEYAAQTYRLPMFSEHIRSLNLSNVATTVAYECLRHL
jgi:tRNA (cytidine/uridine-2'-O-)-methyltransferase